MDRRIFMGGALSLLTAGPTSAQMATLIPDTLPPTQTPAYMVVGDEKVPVWVYVSPTAQRARLVVFSHGALAEPQVYGPLLEFFTTHGFCVVAPIHRDSVIHDGLKIREDTIEKWSFDSLLNDRELWETRARDCLIAAYMFPTIANTLGVTIDASNPIIIGHSFGAFTAQILLGVKVQTPDGDIQYENSFWSGGILLSPQGSGVLGLNEQSWQNMSAPLMVFTSAKDNDLTEQEPVLKTHPYYFSPPGYKHLAFLSKGDNTIYSGQRARPNTEEHYIFSDIKGAMNMFLQAYSARNQEAFEALYGDDFMRRSYSYVTLASR
jgi:pimeloyl-ACP methyl ester carboxylesterase